MGSLSYVLAVAVLAALVAGGACIPKVPPGPNITTKYDIKWLPAKATWYGKPNGAGPKDNGMRHFLHCDLLPEIYGYYRMNMRVWTQVARAGSRT
jgi:hypothetical protein